MPQMPQMPQMPSAYCQSESLERPNIEASNSVLISYISFQSAHGLRLVWHQLNLAGFNDLELLEKLYHLIELWLQDAFQGAWVSLYFSGWLNKPSLHLWQRCLSSHCSRWPILWFDLGRFFARWLLAWGRSIESRDSVLAAGPRNRQKDA